MSDEAKQEPDFVLDLEFSNNVKEEYLQLYRDMVQNLSVSHLDDFAEILKTENKAFNQEAVLENFRDDFLKTITKSLVKSWDSCNIAVNLSTLRLLENKFKNTKKPGWRPHGKTIDELAIPNRIKILNAERKFLEKHLSWQKIKLEEVLIQNYKCRKQIEEIKKQRECLSDHMIHLTKETPRLKEQLVELAERVISKDCEDL